MSLSGSLHLYEVLVILPNVGWAIKLKLHLYSFIICTIDKDTSALNEKGLDLLQLACSLAHITAVIFSELCRRPSFVTVCSTRDSSNMNYEFDRYCPDLWLQDYTLRKRYFY